MEMTREQSAVNLSPQSRDGARDMKVNRVGGESFTAGCSTVSGSSHLFFAPKREQLGLAGGSWAR